MSPLLSVRGLRVQFRGAAGQELDAVDGISFDVLPGEIVALVGESGSGKTLTGLSLLDLVPEPGRITSGEILFEGQDVRTATERQKQKVRGGGIGLVFQEPGSALDPVRTIGSELIAVLRRHRHLNGSEARREAVRWLERVSLPEPERRMDDLPHRMSGGMRQRATIALALAGGPRLLVADEPTTALDVTIQAQILKLLLELRRELGLAVLLITHDLGVVAETADRVLVMYSGEIVESASVHDLFSAPAHPYTRGLMASRPSPHEHSGGKRLQTLEGTVPELGHRPQGCAFEPRCPEAFGRCQAARPIAFAVPDRSSRAACFLWDGGARETRDEPLASAASREAAPR
ncbi:MAG: ABC transporter ATP-binding protein [Thermoanaerobaculia bacterium]